HDGLLVSCRAGPQAVHSFPTRRSSDLVIGLCFAAISANAADPFGPSFNGTNYTENAFQSHSWTGVYFGGGLGYQIGTTDLDYHRDRKSTRLNSSHVKSSYAVFCL